MTAIPHWIAYLPMLANITIALISTEFGGNLYANDVGVSYTVSIGASVGALASLPLLAARDIGPGRLLSVISVQTFALILINAGIHHANKLSSDGKPEPVDFDTAVYFSTVTWTTLGYGDYAPVPDLQLLAALEAFTGLIFFGLLIGLAVSQLIDRNVGRQS